MIEFPLLVMIGLLGGIAVGTQAPIAGAMSVRVGGASSSLIVHVGGLIASLILVVARGGENIQEWKTLPWYMLGCGVLGLVLYLTLSQTIPKLGATAAITLLIIGQLFAGMLVDHFGAFDVTIRSIDSSRVLAMILLLIGGYLMIR